MMKISGIEGMTIDQIKAELKRGGRFVIFLYCFSIIIMSFRRPSRIYFIKAGEDAIGKGVGYTVISLLFGWWGLHGLIWTIQSVITNLRGGKDFTFEVIASLGIEDTIYEELISNRLTKAEKIEKPKEPVSQYIGFWLGSWLGRIYRFLWAILYQKPGSKYAGFWRRFIAFIIDYGLILLVSTIVIFISMIMIPKLTGHYEYSKESTNDLFGFANVIFSFLLYLVYSCVMESSHHQATLGKKALGIIVTDLNGNKIIFVRALWRNLAKLLSWLILYVGFIMAGFTKKKQALHDIIANCLVGVKGSTAINFVETQNDNKMD